MPFVGFARALVLAFGTLVVAVPGIADPTQSEALTVSSINLRWFGKGTETRVQSIKQYLADQGLLTDVMVFQEIVDINLLKRDVLGTAYTCQSYDGAARNHQYVVVCYRARYRLDKAEGETNYALESVNTSGGLRPAVHGVLKNARGERLLHIFGVHLKAMPDSSAVRLTQVRKLAEYMQTRRDPMLIIGDFNTYESDPERMGDIFATVGLTEVEMPQPFTWASATEEFPPAKFDRVWVSDGMLADVADERIEGPCSSGDDDLIGAYNTKVSDHCAPRLTLTLTR